MKIKLNDEVLYDISDLEKKILLESNLESDLEKNIKDVLTWTIKGFCENTKENIKKQWLPILFKRYESIPTSDSGLFSLIFSQTDYKSKDQKDFESKAQSSTSFKEE